MIALIAVGSLLLAAALVPVIGLGVLVAPFLLGLFGLALAGVLSRLEDQTVRRRDPSLEPRRWRDGS